MTTRIAATTTPAEAAPKVTAFATRDDKLKRVSVVVGRHESCTKEVNIACTKDPTYTPLPTPAPTPVDVTVSYPYGSTARVVVKQIPNVRGAVTPITVFDADVTVSGGKVLVPISTFADGEAYTITVG